MRRQNRHATIALAVGLVAACGSAAPDPVTIASPRMTTTTSLSRGSAMEGGTPSTATTSTATRGPASAGATSVGAGAYIDRTTYERAPGRYHAGTVVLFFHAPWCPVCREVDESLTSGHLPAGLTVVKVDFDSDLALRRRYDVTTQHTFVQVDASGAGLARWTTARTADEILAGTL